MVRPNDYIAWLSQVDKDDVLYVGAKPANLGEMIKAGFPVPNGFALTVYAYFYFLKYNKLDLKIKHLFGTIDFKSNDSVNQVSQNIKKIIIRSEIPQEILIAVFEYYKSMGSLFKDCLVAIKSSACEDSKNTSFAGQQEAFSNVRGEADLLEKIKEGWASLFDPRAIFYRYENHLNDLTAGISLVVQKMIESEESGVIFTIDPVTFDKTKIIIESIYGLREYIIQGKVTPDRYEIDKNKLEIKNKIIADQKIMLKKAGIENREQKVANFKRKKQKITDKDILELAKFGKLIENYYYYPQEIEWMKEKDKLYIVQAKPITRMNGELINRSKGQLIQSLVLLGDPASPGIRTGLVKILKNAREIGKINQDDVLVTNCINFAYISTMKKAAAIITEKRDATNFLKGFGIPAVTGVNNAMSILKQEDVVTLNGKTGEIFRRSSETVSNGSFVPFKTATKLYVSIADLQKAEEIALMNVDGVGLLRAEFMIAEIGIHPKKIIQDKKQKMFIDKLSQNIETVCKAFYPRPVIYRAVDFKTNEYRDLKGGQDFEPFESNPTLGYRGAFRYIHDPEVFLLELEAIKRVRNQKALNNLSLMIPFVRTVRELEEVKKLVNLRDLNRGTSFQLYMMIEIPSNVILLEDFIKTGVDGVSIELDALTMLVLGIDRDNSEVAVEFDPQNEAVLRAVEKIIKTCNKFGVKSSICGQEIGLYPDLIEKLVNFGITSISVSRNSIGLTRETIYKAEKNILRKGIKYA